MLDQFMQQRASERDEDDEEDIYKRYQEMASRASENEDFKPNFSSLNTDAKELKPDLPGFEEYFRAEAEGVHPFDKIVSSFDQSEINTPEEHQAEMQREQELYKRQLIGKLIGQQLTSSEYEILNGFYQDEDLRRKRVLDTTNAEFLENRQQVRLF